MTTETQAATSMATIITNMDIITQTSLIPDMEAINMETTNMETTNMEIMTQTSSKTDMVIQTIKMISKTDMEISIKTTTRTMNQLKVRVR